jgi:hypothetical protein
MNMSTNLTLPFGCNQGVPDNVELAWGARWIVQGGSYMDQLGDRMGTAVRDDIAEQLDAATIEAMKDDLFAYLNEHVKMEPRENARHLHIVGKLSDRDPFDTVVTIFDDPKCKVVASCQRSYGYVYVAAWLKDHVTLSDEDVQKMEDLRSAQELDDADERDRAGLNG